VRPLRPDFAFLTGWEAVLVPMLVAGYPAMLANMNPVEVLRAMLRSERVRAASWLLELIRANPAAAPAIQRLEQWLAGRVHRSPGEVGLSLDPASAYADIAIHGDGHITQMRVRDPNGRAYNRTAFLHERRKMMQAWSDYLDKLKADAGDPETQIQALLTPDQTAAYPGYKRDEASFNARTRANLDMAQLREATLGLTSEQEDRAFAALYQVSFDRLTGATQPYVKGEVETMLWSMEQQAKALEPVPGVQEVSVDVSARTATVTGTADSAAVIAALAAAEYPGTLLAG